VGAEWHVSDETYQALTADRLQARQQLEAEQPTEGEADRALAAAVSTYCRSISISVQWRSTPSIIEATSDDDGDFNCECMHSDFRSTCQ
jgi:hypothetical protein